MECFQENYCRLCLKAFCCRNCRCQHEERVHNVNPDCEICIYGRSTVKEASASLLNHIKKSHWPLHCVFCKKIFSTLDELIPHEKCPLKLEYFKMQTTPKTPVTDNDAPSPEMTPFYKTTNQLQIGTIAMGVTSTPLLHKEETNKITPINQSQIKSNLKLTGSSNFSDSKKSERRVTFSETPSVSEPRSEPKTGKFRPLTIQIEDQREEDDISNVTDDSYSCMEEEIYKTAPCTAQFENQELVPLRICNSTAIWESALSTLDLSTSNITEGLPCNTNHFNVSVQINMFNTPDKNVINVKHSSCNIWSSVRSMMKSVVNNISMTAQNSFSNVSIKRARPDFDVVSPSVKRMKLTELKCRRPIREISPSYIIPLAKPRYVDKETQTEGSWM